MKRKDPVYGKQIFLIVSIDNKTHFGAIYKRQRATFNNNEWIFYIADKLEVKIDVVPFRWQQQYNGLM